MILNFLKKQKTNALIEQGLISILNFGAVLIFAKFLKVEDFSQFIIIYSIISLSYLLSTFFVTSPLLVFLPKYWKSLKNTYLIHLFLINVLFSSIIVIFTFLVYGCFKTDVFSIEAFFFAIFWTCYELLRKYVFASGIKIYGLTVASFLLTFIFFSLIFYGVFFSELNINDVFSVYCFSYFVSIVILAFYVLNFDELKKELNSYKVFETNIFREIFKTHFIFSKWLILGAIGFWIYSQGYYMIAAEYLTDLELGKVRTIQNIMGVFSILMVVFENYYSSKAAEVYILGGSSELSLFTRKFYLKNMFLYAFIFTIIGLVGFILYNIFYLDIYDEGTGMLCAFALSQIILFASKPLIIALRAKEVTFPFTISHFVSAAFIVTLGLVLANYYKDIGMSLGFLFSSILFTLVILVYYKKKIK